jgi:hypothetical protein
MNAPDQLRTIEWGGQDVVAAKTDTVDLRVKLRLRREYQNRRSHPRPAQSAQYLMAVDAGRHQIQENKIVVLEGGYREIEMIEIDNTAAAVLPLQGRADTGGGGPVILDKKHAHLRTQTRTLQGRAQELGM